jgi:uncharacterized membrane protein (UPF0127 family)
MTLPSRSLLVAAALLLVLVMPARAQAPLQSFAVSSLTIDTAKGPQRFSIEIATTPQQQEQGLMFRRELAADAGMLFIFPDVRTAEFWMHDTLIPLDMIFIAADGHIADIHERAVPMSDAVITSRVPVRAVLEVNGGTVGRLGIKDGDLVRYPLFGTAPAAKSGG